MGADTTLLQGQVTDLNENTEYDVEKLLLAFLKGIVSEQTRPRDEKTKERRLTNTTEVLPHGN